ncbi:MAG: antA/AntB antirepressor family protein [Clostridia bacterium]|jgi:phage anti-repressor protein|nr:antA/AntB antirepressor family protein [Clostridia bacterium]
MLNNIIENTEKTPIEIALKMDKDGFVSGKNLYNFLQLDKGNYTRWCKSNIEENPFAEKNIDYISFLMEEERNPNPTTEYKLTASFAKKLSMMSKTERGEAARNYFIGCEEALKRVAEEQIKWQQERAKGVVIRHVLTDTIKMKIADSPHKRFAYPNYTKLIYKTIFGKSLEELKTDFGVKPKESIREYMTADQLQEVESLEMLISGLINIGKGYQEIKKFIEENYHNSRLVA